MRIQSTAVAILLVIKIWFFHGFFVKLLVDFWFSLSVRDGLFLFRGEGAKFLSFCLDVSCIFTNFVAYNVITKHYGL